MECDFEKLSKRTWATWATFRQQSADSESGWASVKDTIKSLICDRIVSVSESKNALIEFLLPRVEREQWNEKKEANICSIIEPQNKQRAGFYARRG